MALVIENTAERCESPTLCVQASLSGNGRGIWAALTITGRIEVLGQETEFQVEMGTEGRVRSDKSNKQRAEEACGKTS